MKKTIFIFILISLALIYFKKENVAGLPLGELNPAVSQDNLKETACKANWTSTVRPSSQYTNALKLKQLKGYQDQDPSHYEEDHYIPLVLGGSPKSEKNLWPQSYLGQYNARDKDKVENYLHRQLCKGAITLIEAQKEIRSWKVIYDSIGQNFGSLTDPDETVGNFEENR